MPFESKLYVDATAISSVIGSAKYEGKFIGAWNIPV
jgi:hypothetical protein